VLTVKMTEAKLCYKSVSKTLYPWCNASIELQCRVASSI